MRKSRGDLLTMSSLSSFEDVRQSTSSWIQSVMAFDKQRCFGTFLFFFINMLVLSCCIFQSSMAMVWGLDYGLAVCFYNVRVCVCEHVSVCVRQTSPLLLNEQHECGVTVSVRTTALTLNWCSCRSWR